MPFFVRLRLLALLIPGLAVVSCATNTKVLHSSRSETRETQTSPAFTPQAATSQSPSRINIPARTEKSARTFTGQVEFRDFTDQALNDFRIIPEEGRTLFKPVNGIHRNVDGFWWRAERRWFKIPDHCSVVVAAAPAPSQTSAFTETHDCSSIGSALQKLRGRPDKPGFVPDEGRTRHGTNYPFGG